LEEQAPECEGLPSETNLTERREATSEQEAADQAGGEEAE
jgi:hypothetical protein